MMRPVAVALAALAVLVTSEPIPQLLGSATVTLATDGATVPVVVPFPTFVPPGLIPVASSILLKERDATTTSDPLDFLGSATVTLVTDGVTVPVVVPFPTFVPPGVIPIASSILLKERDATTTSDPLDFIGSATVTLVTDGVTVPVVIPFPTFVPPGVIPIASSILLKERDATTTSDPLDFIGSATVTLVTDGVTVPVVVPFPTFVPPGVIPIASSILLKEKRALQTPEA